MVIFPKAKINLGLRITGRRSDGYHDLETLFYPVGLRDALEFTLAGDKNGRDYLTLTGIDIGGDSNDNIILKALAMLRRKFQVPGLSIHLHKAIPHGAGLGGGSSDAAYFLKSLNSYFSLGMNAVQLHELALETGSDCPFFIEAEPAFAKGRGEKLEPAKHVLSGYYLVLVNPGVIISTREAYGNCRPEVPAESLALLTGRDISEWKNRVLNDFEEYAFTKHPEIKKIKDEFYRNGAVFSLMSGSGSSVYGIYPSEPSLSGIIRKHMIWKGKL